MRNLSTNKLDKRLYEIWRHMHHRCYNPKNTAYKYYGGKGITVCEEWNSFVYFALWAVQNGYSDDLTLDRIDPSGNYTPDNCRWTTMTVQANNRKKGIVVVINGTPKSFSVRKRNKKWEYRIETGTVDGKRKRYSKCGFNTKEDAIHAAEETIKTKILCPPQTEV